MLCTIMRSDSASSLRHELGELGVVRQHVVGADLVAEELLRRGDLGRRLLRAAGRRQRKRDGQADEAHRREI